MGYRLYWGAPNTELRLHWERQDKARDSLPKGWRCIYFPVEAKYMVFNEHHMPVTNELHQTVEGACHEATQMKENIDAPEWHEGYTRAQAGGDRWSNPYFEKNEPLKWFNYVAGWEAGK